MQTYSNEIETEYPTDSRADPTRYARERIRAAQAMLERHCNHLAVSKQLALAVEALDLADHWAGRPRVIRGWGGTLMDNNTVIEFRGGPRPSTEPSPEPATVLEFRKKAAPAPAVAAPAAESEPLCPHCWTLNTSEVAVTSAVAAQVDPEEILDRVFSALDELGVLPPPPVAGSGA